LQRRPFSEVLNRDSSGLRQYRPIRYHQDSSRVDDARKAFQAALQAQPVNQPSLLKQMASRLDEWNRRSRGVSARRLNATGMSDSKSRQRRVLPWLKSHRLDTVGRKYSPALPTRPIVSARPKAWTTMKACKTSRGRLYSGKQDRDRTSVPDPVFLQRPEYAVNARQKTAAMAGEGILGSAIGKWKSAGMRSISASIARALSKASSPDRATKPRREKGIELPLPGKAPNEPDTSPPVFAGELRDTWRKLSGSGIHVANRSAAKVLDWSGQAMGEVFSRFPILAGGGNRQPERTRAKPPQIGKGRKRQPTQDRPADPHHFSKIGKAWVDAISKKSEARANNVPRIPLQPLK
jgi:hypothetical protein